MSRPMTTLALTAAVAASVMLAACNKDDKDHGPVVASVNGAPIHEDAVTKPLANVPAQLLEGREEQLRQQVLDQLIQRELIRQEGARLNLHEDAAFKEQMQQMEDQLTYNFVLKHQLEKALTDEKLKEAYEKTKQSRAFPAVKARHILVKTEQEAKDLLKVVTPANFADMAKEKSTGPTGPNGGDLGWFRKESMIPAFADLAFATKPGTVAQTPVQTQFGWHVVFVEDKNDAYVPSFEQVKGALQSELSQQIVQDYLQDLRNNARVDIMPAKADDAEKPAADAPEAK